MRTRLLIAFLIVIIAALGTVLVVSNFSANTQVRGYLRWSMNANSMVFAEELKSYYQEHGSWSGVERMFTESGGDSSMLLASLSCYFHAQKREPPVTCC